MKLAVIPARGGSQRIPRKNIREFCGKPLIAYSIQAALDSGCFDEVMVSTDDDEIASLSKSFGALVPFKRSIEASSHTATTAEVLLEVLRQYKDRGVAPTHLCCLYPTAPFVTPEILNQALGKLIEAPDTNAVIPVVRFSYPIQRALRLQNGYLGLFQNEHLLSRSQDLEPAYHDAGQFYWLKTSSFLVSKNLMGPGTVGLILSEREVQDIDNENDWALAELKFKLMSHKL